MGVRRYSLDRNERRWQERFDDLQHRCHSDWTLTVGELLEHGIMNAQWRCRNTGWQNDGRGDCWHASEVFDLTRFGPKLTVSKMRRMYVCSKCGRDRPFLELWAE